MYFLVDPDSGIVRASYKTLDGIPINGFRVVSVPDNVPIDPKIFGLELGDSSTVDTTDTDLDSLIDAKLTGLLASQPLFSNIVGDELEDDGPWDLSDVGSTTLRFAIGKGTSSLLDSGPLVDLSVLETNLIPADAVVDTVMVYWDIYTITKVTNGYITQLFYEPVDPNILQVSVSNTDGPPNWEFDIPFMEPVTFDSPDDEFRLRFFNVPPSSTRYYIGSFAILY
jgi:hypothetical protein